MSNSLRSPAFTMASISLHDVPREYDSNRKPRLHAAQWFKFCIILQPYGMVEHSHSKKNAYRLFIVIQASLIPKEYCIYTSNIMVQKVILGLFD